MVEVLFDGGGDAGAELARTPVPSAEPTATPGWPPRHSRPLPPLAPGERADPADRPSGRVLVVDDSEENRQMLCRRLERQGHRAEAAASGAECLDRLRGGAFDLVLLDVMMPELDGYAVLGEIKADPRLRPIPVVMISAQSDLDGVVRCIELGAEDYLPKPFNPTLLKARVNASLEKHRLREQEQAHREQTLRAEATLERHRSLAQMVAGVAHEINTPLGIASTAQSIIEQRLSSPEVRSLFGGNPQLAATFEDVLEAVTLLKGNVLRAHRLVETFKKISVSQITENQEVVSLPALVGDCVDLFRITARQAGLAVLVDASGLRGDPLWQGYPGCFTQVLMNLLQNIERYAYPGGAGGPVEILIADQEAEGGGEFRVAVRDHGAG
ncbi:MAG: hybrid sensor histidine kinase/response regulator, partial [Gammaproteobacteria bacterium]|nr:hybrid sensor histidine kinase/response regulator [Gammaproteobacteria bacterium]